MSIARIHGQGCSVAAHVCETDWAADTPHELLESPYSVQVATRAWGSELCITMSLFRGVKRKTWQSVHG
jgi:hypothetical protein